MLYDAALLVGISDEKGHAYLPRIRALAARHEGDPFAQRVLAHAELQFGDAATADRLLDGLLASSPNDAELLYLKGMRHLLAAERDEAWQAEAAEARRWFGRAHQADANHYQTLFRYAQSLRRDPGFISENNIDVMLLAHQLAPQVAEITLNAASMLIAHRDNGIAINLLRPLASDPHNAELAQAARQMIEVANGAAPSPASSAAPASPPAPQRPN
jgi:tetratricopeptide (TPR) repeat protein